MKRQLSLFENVRLTLDGAIDLSLNSLREYGSRYQHWVGAYSGGKDSTATIMFIAWAIKKGLVPQPKSFTVIYSDTRLELVPLQQTAMGLMAQLRANGIDCRVVMPPIYDRFFVYMLGRGVPPSSNTFRWCTEKLKIKPMQAEQERIGVELNLGQMVFVPKRDKEIYHPNEQMLLLTGVRLGESAARDQRIALSCTKNSGECGQGWFQVSTPESVAVTLAPLLHWRLCHVYDWIYFEKSRHKYDADDIALIYGDEEVRTGCMGCPLASRDVALERLVKQSGWGHLTPLLELKPLYRELKKPEYRLRKNSPEKRKDGKYSKNVQRLGPLTMAARAYSLERVLDIQDRAGVDLINAEEENVIRAMWVLNIWPNRWTGTEITGDRPVDALKIIDTGDVAVQALLVR